MGVLAGAKYRIGTESKYEFSEPSAPEVSNNHCMGDSLLFSARDRGEPVKYVAPEWAYHFSEEDLAIRPHTSRMVFNASDGSVYSEKKAGSLADVIVGADVFIGVSAPGVVTEDMVRSMAKDAIVFPMANPTPEIMPDLALAAGARVVGTGRSDFPNQINNVLAFPGIFRGALDVRASDINDEMKIAAAKAIAGLVSDEELTAEYILPAAFDPRVKDAVAKATAEAAIRTGVARKVTE